MDEHLQRCENDMTGRNSFQNSRTPFFIGVLMCFRCVFQEFWRSLKWCRGTFPRWERILQTPGAPMGRWMLIGFMRGLGQRNWCVGKNKKVFEYHKISYYHSVCFFCLVLNLFEYFNIMYIKKHHITIIYHISEWDHTGPYYCTKLIIESILLVHFCCIRILTQSQREGWWLEIFRLPPARVMVWCVDNEPNWIQLNDGSWCIKDFRFIGHEMSWNMAPSWIWLGLCRSRNIRQMMYMNYDTEWYWYFHLHLGNPPMQTKLIRLWSNQQICSRLFFPACTGEYLGAPCG